jgi:hypothetical protein
VQIAIAITQAAKKSTASQVIRVPATVVPDNETFRAAARARRSAASEVYGRRGLADAASARWRERHPTIIITRAMPRPSNYASPQTPDRSRRWKVSVWAIVVVIVALLIFFSLLPPLVS